MLSTRLGAVLIIPTCIPRPKTTSSLTDGPVNDYKLSKRSYTFSQAFGTIHGRAVVKRDRNADRRPRWYSPTYVDRRRHPANEALSPDTHLLYIFSDAQNHTIYSDGDRINLHLHLPRQYCNGARCKGDCGRTSRQWKLQEWSPRFWKEAHLPIEVCFKYISEGSTVLVM
jgi:hypothetical protein